MDIHLKNAFFFALLINCRHTREWCKAKICLLFCPAIALGVRYAGLAAAIARLGNTRGFFIMHV
jgi:hypothetical protein